MTSTEPTKDLATSSNEDTPHGDDDEELRLPADTLAHLQSFLAERREREAKFEALAARAEKEHLARLQASNPSVAVTADDPAAALSEPAQITMDLFEEDWQMSQFWYDEPTRAALAEELSFADFGFRTRDAGDAGDAEPINVAIVSAPSVFVTLLNLQSAGKIPRHIRPVLLEHDTRFAVLCPPSAPSPRFVEYDFMNPLDLPADLKGKFDAVLVDPPFLSEDCQTKAALTVRWLVKQVRGTEGEREKGVGTRVVVCTGERMAGLVGKLYKKEGVRETDWVVGHQRGLGNEFRCLASWEGKRWRWVKGGEGEE
ncbi:putative N6-adenine methyltransferase-domain-containing protein [Kalaharituber pfeilii]|nr:putative N6-adenine methyltransferase-domain-containing protein [Kalaharituber pfeilii]